MATAKPTPAKTLTKTPAKTPSKAPLKAASKAPVKASPKPAAKAPASPAPAKKAAKAPAPAADKKTKLVRDSFTMPKAEYTAIDALKARAAELKRPTKKSEILRAGVAAMAKLPDAALVAALDALPTIKTGRPRKG